MDMLSAISATVRENTSARTALFEREETRNMKMDAIETPRLRLRGFRKDDALFAIGIWNDRRMGEYLPDPELETVDADYLHEIEALGEDDECCYLIAEAKQTGERIGTCSFIPDADQGNYDIAYCVHQNFWRQGYATEMAKGMICYALQHGAGTVTARVNRENAASNAIMRRLGFTVVGEKSYPKRGTEQVFTDYCYALKL